MGVATAPFAAVVDVLAGDDTALQIFVVADECGRCVGRP
jgi:hypothetical protein